MTVRAADSQATIPLAAAVLRRTWRTRLGLATILLSIGGALLHLHAVQGWAFVAIGGAFAVNSLLKLRGMGASPRIEFREDRIDVWGLLLGSPRSIRYKNIPLVEWQRIGQTRVARLATNAPIPLVISSTVDGSREIFDQLIMQFEARLPVGSIIDRQKAQPHRPLASLFAIVALIAVHVSRWLWQPDTDAMSLIVDGAFVPALVASGEWFRIFTAAFLHTGALHLAINLAFIGFGFAELEECIGQARTIILMVSGTISASLVAYFASSHTLLVGASGMAYAAIGAIAVQLAVRPAQAPISFRMLPSWVLPTLVAGDAVAGLLLQQVSLAMHAGGFLGGALTMGALLRTSQTPSRKSRWMLNAVATGGVALVVGSAYALLQYRVSGHPQRLMLVRLLDDETPKEIRNSATYRLALNPTISRQELAVARRGAEQLLAMRVPPQELAAYLDTAAALNSREGNVQQARALERRAIGEAISLPAASRAELPSYIAHLAQFDLAVPPLPDVPIAITPAPHALCFGAVATRSPAQSLRAVVLRRDAPIGLLLVPNTHRTGPGCIAAAVAATDTVRVTYAGAPLGIESPRFFAIRPTDADLPPFVVSPPSRLQRDTGRDAL